MSDPLTQLRTACAEVAGRARHVSIARGEIERYAESLPLAAIPSGPDPKAHLVTGTREELAAFWLALDAINFGSGWFPTLRKRRGRSGYFTIASALGQDPGHELMGLFAASLRDLGGHVLGEYGGQFAALVDNAGPSAVSLVAQLATWRCFEDTSRYGDIEVPFLKRAQIAAADLTLARVAAFADLERLTIFADNLVPHVLRLDGVLVFEPGLVKRIERGQLSEHDSPEEIEMRACAVHAVELIAAHAKRPAAELDRLLWQRGQHPRYKSRPRHRSRSTAY